MFSLFGNLRVPVQTKQISHSSVPGVVDEIVKCPLASRGINPFLQRASWQIAIVVDDSRPSRHDVQPRISVSCHGCVERPECVGIAKQRAGVVADHVKDTVVHPASDNVGVVETSDCRGDNAAVAPTLRGTQSNLFQPCPVESDLLGRVGVGRIS
jgi:hypothetical protein